MRRPLCAVCTALSVIILMIGQFKAAFGGNTGSNAGEQSGKSEYGEGIDDNSVSSNAQMVDLCAVVENADAKYYYLRSVCDAESLGLAPDSGVSGGEGIRLKADLIPDIYLPIGTQIRCSAKVRGFSPARNDGEFDAKKYYEAKGIIYDTVDISSNSVYIISDRVDISRNSVDINQFSVNISRIIVYIRSALVNIKYSVRESLRVTRSHFEDRLYSVFPERQASVMADLLLGDKVSLDRDVKDLYQNNGIAHILSISALHITILGYGLHNLLKRSFLGIRGSAVVCSILLILYGVMTGMSVSATRAIGCFVLAMIALIIGRTYDSPTGLSLLAAICLIRKPSVACDAGFMLSFGSAAGILLLLPVLKRAFPLPKKRCGVSGQGGVRAFSAKVIKVIYDSLLASLSVTIFTLPIQLYFYYEIPRYAVILNIFILPFMSLLVFSGLIAMLIPGLGFIGSISLFILSYFEKMCLLFEKIPGYKWNPGKPTMAGVAVYYAVLFFMIAMSAKVPKSRTHKKGGRSSHIFKLFPVVCGVIMLLVVISIHPSRRNTADFLYVGQGSCCILTADNGAVYMFDCGSTSRSSVGKYVLKPFLKYHGIKKIDAVFISHADEDHVNGAIELLQNKDAWGIEVGDVFVTAQMMDDDSDMMRNLLSLCNDVGVSKGKTPSIRYMRSGITIRSGKTKLLCLHPAPDYIPEDPNSASECFLVTFGNKAGTTLLLTGDVQGTGETALTQNLSSLANARSVDILVVSHHGSSHSTTDEFLNVANPRLAIISCGENNRYGHPHTETLGRLKKHGAHILRTDTSGQITIYIKNNKLRVKLFTG